MFDFTEKTFDIYVSVQIDFMTEEKDKDETVEGVLTQLESLFNCFNVEYREQAISLYKGSKIDNRFPKLESYYMNMTLSFDYLTYSQLQIAERTFHNLISFWNENLFKQHWKDASLRISVYETGKRP